MWTAVVCAVGFGPGLAHAGAKTSTTSEKPWDVFAAAQLSGGTEGQGGPERLQWAARFGAGVWIADVVRVEARGDVDQKINEKENGITVPNQFFLRETRLDVRVPRLYTEPLTQLAWSAGLGVRFPTDELARAHTRAFALVLSTGLSRAFEGALELGVHFNLRKNFEKAAPSLSSGPLPPVDPDLEAAAACGLRNKDTGDCLGNAFTAGAQLGAELDARYTFLENFQLALVLSSLAQLRDGSDRHWSWTTLEASYTPVRVLTVAVGGNLLVPSLAPALPGRTGLLASGYLELRVIF